MSPPRARRWEVIYDELREAIDQRKRAPGDPLPTEHDLAATHGVGRDTVRRALQQLEAHGLITAAHGSQGRKVREFAPLTWNLSRFERGDRRDDPDQGIDEWAADMREQGRTPSETVETAGLGARADAAAYLALATDSWVYRRRRYRYVDGDLVSIADTWMPEWVSERPANSENGEPMRDEDGKILYPFKAQYSLSLPGGLIRAVGLRQAWFRDLHFARYPTPNEAEALGTNDPVAEVVRIGYDREDKPFRAMITVSPGHLLAAQYVLRVGGDDE